MKRYSEYKDSGVKWIGEIPGHWECRKLKFLTSSMQSGDNLTAIQIKEIGKYPVYGGNGIRGYYDDSNCNKQCIVIGRQGALCGNVHIVKKPFWATDHAVVTYANENTDLDFLFYLTKAMNLNQYASQTAAQPGIAVSAIKNIYTCYPPLPEQEAIVTYLDSKVAKIDEYISIAEKKIAALEELKQTIITEAVTRGIHKDVPMKDSGVKWIGMIPEHWEIRRLKNIVLCNSDTLSENFPKEEVIKYVEISDVNYTSGIINVQNISFGEAPSRARRITKKNDVIVSTVRTYLKAVAKIQEDGLIVSTGFAVLHPIIGNSSFLSYFVLSESFINNVIADSKGISYPAISTSDLVCIAMPLPPLSEQQEIVTYLDSKVANINQLCQAERSQIEKLKEYKQRLISDVVTGKVKVTND